MADNMGTFVDPNAGDDDAGVYGGDDRGDEAAGVGSDLYAADNNNWGTNAAGDQGEEQISSDMNDKLEEWVAAKRARDFVTADRLRSELEANGYHPEKLRPPPGGGGRGGPYDDGRGRGGGGFGGDGHRLFDEWLAAKRRRDFETSDRLRAEMKSEGFNPETYHPNKPGGDGGYGGGGGGGGYGGYGGGGGYRGDGYNDGGGGGYRGDGYNGGRDGGGGGHRLLEEWVAAKRRRDFETSDRLRAEMKSEGFNPEAYRPNKPGGDGGYGGGGDYRGDGRGYGDDDRRGYRDDDRRGYRDDDRRGYRDDDRRGGRDRSYSPDRRRDDYRR